MRENTADDLIAIDTRPCVHLITQKAWIVDFRPIDSITAKTLYCGVEDTRETNPIAIEGEGKIERRAQRKQLCKSRGFEPQTRRRQHT